jgi:hypothetical protein
LAVEDHIIAGLSVQVKRTKGETWANPLNRNEKKTSNKLSRATGRFELRLDARTRRSLDTLAHRLRLSRAAVVKRALTLLEMAGD